jgi:NitT/TauT family transport system substrate-binding protein
MNKKIIGLALLVFFSIITVSCNSLTTTLTGENQKNDTSANSYTPVNVCYSAASGAQSVTWYAQENKLFEKYGLDVNLVYINGGSKSATALITKEMDFCSMAGDGVVNANLAGEDLVIIASFFNTYPGSIMVKPEIKTPIDLKGKTIANHNKFGGVTDNITRLTLNRLQLKPDQDVKLLPVGDQGERLLSMEATPEIVGTLIIVPFTLKAEEQGYQELVDIASLNLPYQYIGIGTTKSYLAKNPDTATNFIKAILEAIALMKQDKQGTIKVMAKYLNLDPKQDAKVLDVTYDILITKYLEEIPLPNSTSVQTILNLLAKNNPEASNFKPEEMIDISFVKELETKEFGKKK